MNGRDGAPHRLRPGKGWLAVRGGAALAVVAAYLVFDLAGHPWLGMLEPVAGMAGSLCLLAGAWTSIGVREELTRLSLIVSEDKVILEAAQSMSQEEQSKMLDLIRTEWRMYAWGVALLCVSFGLDLGGRIRTAVWG